MRSALGSIQKKGEDYYLVAVTVGTDPETGRQRRVSRRVRGSKRKAEMVLAQLIVENGLAHDDAVHMTAAEYATGVFLPRIAKEARKYSDTGKGRYKPATYRSYESILRVNILPYIGDMKLNSIKGRDVRRVQDAQATEAMALFVRKVMSALFKEAVYDELMEDNPVSKARAPQRSEPYEPDVLDLDEVAAYLEHFRGHRIEAAVLLAIGGSYRRGEILGLDAEDIDLDTGKVTVSKSLAPLAGGAALQSTKNRKTRTNILPPVILERLREVIPESGPLITNGRGERLHPNRLSTIYKEHCATLPEWVQRVPLRNLRHSSLTLVYDATGSMEQAKEHAGHGDVAITRRHYVRAHDMQEQRTAKAMDDLLREALHGAETVENPPSSVS